VQIDQQHADYGVLRDAALRAEEAGADIVFNLDHFFPYAGDPGGRHFEALTMLAVSARFDPRHADERLELGASLFVIEYAPPPYDFTSLAPWTNWRDARNAPGA
jgi:alkanesulfonate monooxygenase SsuD/methylene tetrahydromethanopterin reductase-like flavin-dependent oxidoreductase (luciferase family)